MVEISCLAATMRASSVRPISFGATSAANMPKITTTTMISIRVNPRCAMQGVPRLSGKGKAVCMMVQSGRVNVLRFVMLCMVNDNKPNFLTVEHEPQKTRETEVPLKFSFIPDYSSCAASHIALPARCAPMKVAHNQTVRKRRANLAVCRRA